MLETCIDKGDYMRLPGPVGLEIQCGRLLETSIEIKETTGTTGDFEYSEVD